MLLTGTKCSFSHLAVEKLFKPKIKALTKRDARWLKITIISCIFLFAATFFEFTARHEITLTM